MAKPGKSMQRASQAKAMGRYGTAGIELVLTVLLVGWAGHWLDHRYWHDSGWGTLGGFAFGIAVAFRNLIRAAKRMQRDIERAERQDPEGSRWTVDESWVHKEQPDSKKKEDGSEPH